MYCLQPGSFSACNAGFEIGKNTTDYSNRSGETTLTSLGSIVISAAATPPAVIGADLMAYHGGQLIGGSDSWLSVDVLKGIGYLGASAALIVSAAGIEFFIAEPGINEGQRGIAYDTGYNYKSNTTNPCSKNLDVPVEVMTAKKVVTGIFAAGSAIAAARWGQFRGKVGREEKQQVASLSVASVL